MSPFSLYLLGPPQLERDGVPLHITRRRTLAFLIYLAVTGEAHPREQLLALFWPDLDAGHARADLRRTIYQVHQILGEEWLITAGETVQVGRTGAFWLDIEAFHQLLAACREHGHAPEEVCPQCLPLLTDAVSLYRADFLSGFALPDSPGFDDWQFFQGETLRAELAAALARLVQGYATQDDYAAAIVYARRWLALDPLHEPAHRWLMQLYAWSDQLAAALRQYVQCAQLLHEELGVTPAPETEVLHRAIQARRLTPLLRRQQQQTPGATTPSSTAPAPADEIRLITAMSVGLAEAMPAWDADALDAVAADAAALLAIAQQAGAPFTGQVEQIAGADLLVLFGVEQVHEDDAERAVRTALAIQEATQTSGIAVRIGITTGMAYCRRSAAGVTVVGSPVNLAPRLRNRAAAGQILVNRNVYLPTRGVFVYTPLTLTLPGFSPLVPAYRVVRLRQHPTKARGVEELRANFIGRRAELAQLHSALDKARQGDGQLVTLVGSAGVGKSRLVSELKARVNGAIAPLALSLGATANESQSKIQNPKSKILWLEGRGLELAISTSYWLFADLLRSYLCELAGAPTGEHSAADAGGEAPAQTLTTVLQWLADADHLPTARVAEMGSLLGRLLSLRVDNGWDDRLTHLRPDQIRRRMVAAVMDLVAALTDVQPLVLLFEDLHWADAHSLDLIQALLALLPAHRLLLLCVYRPEQTQAEEQLAALARHQCPERLTEVHVGPLTTNQSRQLVAALLAVDQLPAVVRSQLIDKAQGNPFFLEEIVRSLIERGLLYRQDDRWQARAESWTMAVPERVQSLILSRIDRLETAPRTVLQIAAVLGQFFHPQVLAAMIPADLALGPALAQLMMHAFIYQVRLLPEAEYAFHHVLVRDAIYQDLPKPRRAALHAQAAAALEGVYADNLTPWLEQLAYHYDEAAVVDKAVTYLLQAGQKAQRAYANQEALTYFHRAETYLAQTDADSVDPQQRLALWDGIGQVYATIGDLQQGEPYLRQAIALAHTLALPLVEQVQRYFPLCHLLGWHGRQDEVLALANEGLALLGGDLTLPEAVMLVTIKSDVYFNRGQHRSAMALFVQIVAILPQFGYARQLLSAYNMAAMWSRYTKQIDQGFALLLSIEQKALAQSDRWLVGHLHGWPVMFLYETIGDLQGVFRSLSKVEEMAAQTGDELLKIQASTYRGNAHGWCCGEWALAAAYAQETMRLTETADMPRKSVFAYVTLGLAYYNRQAWQAAIATLETARQIALATCFRADGARRGDIGLAWSYLRVGRREEAAALFRSVVAEEEADVESLHLITCALAGLAVSCSEPDCYQAQCKQIEVERGAANAFPLLQWQPKPVQPEWRVASEEWRVLDTDLQRPTEGWAWHDPFGDCSYSWDNGLTIRAVNYRDLWLNNLSAPRLLRPICGAFALEVTCTSADPDRPALGGLLLWQDRAHYLRLTWNTHGPGEINLLGCLDNHDLLLGRGSVAAAPLAHLRFERSGRRVRGLYSADGATWYSVGDVDFAAADPLLAGPLAIGLIHRYVYAGEFTEGTAIRFI